MINKECLLQKFPGKGGWTYLDIPEIKPDPQAHFGWVVVSGSIDGYELKKHKLMPKGNGILFLPVKSEIRKKIKKQAGDLVYLILSIDKSPLEIPDEIKLCFKNESPETHHKFMQLSQTEQKAYLDWIYAAKTDETKAQRIIKLIKNLVHNIHFYDKDKGEIQ